MTTTTQCTRCHQPVGTFANICPACGEPTPASSYVGHTTEYPKASNVRSTAYAVVTHNAARETFHRPVWQVVLLSIVTFGLYFFMWLGLTWSEIKRELNDADMSPGWHALSVLVPIYGWFRVHNHYKTIGELAPWWDLSPGLAVAAIMIASLAVNFSPDEAFLYVIVAQGFVLGAVAAYGQAALNAYWARREGEEKTAALATLAATVAQTSVHTS